jgi:inner membrane protein
MPSPVGHALAGVASGWLIRGNRIDNAPGRREAVLFAGLGALADLDLLFGMHSGPTHGIGAAVLAGAFAWSPWIQDTGRARITLAVACMLAYASHILLDWLGSDTSPPIGVMALWPFSREYYESSRHVFMAVSRRYWQPENFWIQNLIALLRELLILVPPLLLIGWWRRVRRP